MESTSSESVYLPIDEFPALSHLSKRTIESRIAVLKKNDPDKYASLLLKAGHKKTYERDLMLAYLAAPGKGISPPSPKPAKTTNKKKRESPPKELPKDLNKLARQIWDEPVLIQLDAYEKAEFEKLQNDEDRERFQMAILILGDWVTCLYTLNQSCERHGGSVRTFHRWVANMTSLSQLYKRAAKKRSQAMRLYRVEEAEINLRRLITGEERDIETVTYLERTLANGKKLLVPQERKMSKKITSPNVTAIIFSLTNDKPNKWKRLNAFEMPVVKEDPIDKMTEGDLLALVDEGRKAGFIANE